MSSKTRAGKARAGAAPHHPQPSTWNWLASDRVIFAGLALAVLLFYFKPLFNDGVAIQWDAVDYQYSAQKYLADSLHSARLPFWTPYVFSGMPFLADPPTGRLVPVELPVLGGGYHAPRH
jgi:hypothetical protein